MGDIIIEREGPVAVVRFDRHGSLNAFSQRLIGELTEVARSFHDDMDTQAVVLAGSAQAFSAGIDLKDPANWQTEAMNDVQRRQRFYSGVRLCKAWEEMPQITVAALEQMAVGAGVALGLACDWRVLGRGAYLYVPEVKIGLNLQWGALPRLITLVGPAKAKRITLLCEKMPAALALDWGVVDELADDGQTVELALQWARKVAALPAPTVRMMKEAINATANALHRVAGFADGDQSQLSGGFAESRAARDNFSKKPK